VTLNGQKAYGVFISPGIGYRNNAAKDTATGDEADGLYVVLMALIIIIVAASTMVMPMSAVMIPVTAT
jgi:hypothetical protein